MSRTTVASQLKRCFRFISSIRLLAAVLIFSCSFPSQRQGNSADPVHAAEKKLLAATLQLLATSEQEHPKAYAQRRKDFDAALTQYLQVAGDQKRIELKARRDSLTFIFPIQIVERDRLQLEMTRGSPSAAFGEPVGLEFKGEILDLAWLPKSKDSPNQIIALFADSVAILAWPDNSRTPFNLRFDQEQLRPIRAAFPTGIFSLRDLNLDQSPEVITLTSNLKSAVVIQREQNRLDTTSALSLPKDDVLASSWNIVNGGDTFHSLISERPAFRSLRPLPETRYLATLDTAGYLNLLTDDSNEPVWESERPWGDRLFVLSPDLIAVCDSRQSAFVVFRLQDRVLQLIGQSPTLNGNVSALFSLHAKDKNGLLVSTVSTDADGVAQSRLRFFPENTLSWILPARLGEPRFPDYNADVTFLQEAEEGRHISPDWHQEYPPAVFCNVFETLYRRNENGNIVPALATRIQSDSTCRIWKIQLRSDIRFSDGSPLTAEMICESWKRHWLSCKKNLCTQQWLWETIVGAEDFVDGKSSHPEGLQVADEHTLKIVLNVARPRFVEHLTQPCFSAMKWKREDNTPLGTGPFRLDEIRNDRSGSLFQCHRNEYYHRGQPALREIKFLFHQLKAMEILKNLEAAGAIIRRKKAVQHFRQTAVAEIRPFSTQAVYFLALNPAAKPLAEASQRRLIAKALDREALAKNIDAAECAVATSFFNVQDENLLWPAETGAWQASRALIIFFRAQDGVAQQIAERLSARLSQLKILSAAPKALPSGSFERLRRSGKYDILIDSYTPLFAAPMYNLMQLLQREYVVDPAVETACEQALASASSNGLANLEKTLVEQVVLYPLVRAQSYVVLPLQLAGAKLIEAGLVNFAQAWLPHPK